jgi:hypothetical protein
MGKSNWLIAKKKKKKKKVGLVRHPQLINMKQKQRIISTPQNKRFKTATKENPGSWIWELKVEWGTSFLII